MALTVEQIEARREKTLESAKSAILEFHAKHGRRPRNCDLRRLRKPLREDCGTTIPRLCDELGLPRLRLGQPPGTIQARGRTLESVKAGVLAYYKVHGIRPTSTVMCAVQSWMVARGMSLARLCDEIGLPPALKGRDSRLGPKLVQDMIEVEVRDYYRETGKRPTAKEMRQHHEYFYSRGSSLSLFCDQLGLPGRAKGAGRPRLSSAAK